MERAICPSTLRVTYRSGGKGHNGHRMRRSLLTLLALTVAFAPAEAQRRRFPTGDTPKWWGSVWGGYQWANTVSDRSTAAHWNFDAGWMFRGTLEREVATNTAIGVAFNYTRMPLTFNSFTAAGGCLRCDADATIATYGLLLRNGGGPGLHVVYELFAGAMQFSKFTFSDPAQNRGDISDIDFAFSGGTGFGYGMSQDFQVIALYEMGRNIHESSGSQNTRRLTTHHIARVGLRVGF